MDIRLDITMTILHRGTERARERGQQHIHVYLKLINISCTHKIFGFFACERKFHAYG